MGIDEDSILRRRSEREQLSGRQVPEVGTDEGIVLGVIELGGWGLFHEEKFCTV